jgi:hypothetical protein
MNFLSWIPNEYFNQNNNSSLEYFYYYELIEEYTPEHPDFNTCPLKLRKILKWAKISNGEHTVIVACNERTDSTIIIMKKILI